MDSIWKIVAEIGAELHPDRTDWLATKIATLGGIEEFGKLKVSIGPGIDKELLNRLGQAWKETDELTPLQLAAALRGASGTAVLMDSREAVEMVWTGPTTGLVAHRHTEEVLKQVISESRYRLFIVSFVAYNIQSVTSALQDAIGRQVRVDILLESSKAHGGKIDIDSLKTMSKQLPSAKFYRWKKNPDSNEKIIGAVHAKCAVTDGNLAFITSANLTRAAMENNMELGVLVKGGQLPDTLARHLEALSTTGVIEQI